MIQNSNDDDDDNHNNIHVNDNNTNKNDKNIKKRIIRVNSGIVEKITAVSHTLTILDKKVERMYCNWFLLKSVPTPILPLFPMLIQLLC